MLAGDTVPVGFGRATLHATLDFETRSGAGFVWDAERNSWVAPEGSDTKGLSTVGLRNYIHHPSFGVISLKYDLQDGRGMRTWYTTSAAKHLSTADRSDPWAAPWELIDHVAAGKTLSAWYSNFERTVWNEHCVPTWGWPELPLEQTLCDMAKGRAHAGPGSLGAFGNAFNLIIKKDKDGDRLLKKFSIPQTPTKKQPKIWINPHDDPEDFAKLLSYNGTDVLSEVEASLCAPDLPADELVFWQTDQRINGRGIGVDVVALENCIEIVRQTYEKYNAEISQLTGGAVKAASEIKKLTDWLRTRGFEMSSMDKEAVAEMLERMEKGGDTKRAEYRVLKIRQMTGSASIKKLWAFKHQNYLGRLYDLYTFFGARTGRWTAMGPQPQNLPTGMFKTLEEVEKALGIISHRVLELVEYHYPGVSALDVIAGCLRGLLVAAPGHEFVCSDYTGIENVVAAALAGEQWVLDVYHTHAMIYEATASKIAKIPFDDFVKHRTDTGGVAVYKDGKLMEIKAGPTGSAGKHHPLRKKLGKYGALGSQFGGWINAWVNFGADEFLTRDEIKQGILAWRDANPNIVEFWGGQSRGRFRDARPELYGLEGAAIAAIQYPGKPFSPGTNPNITYQMSVVDDILYCRTASGGFLTYHRPRLEGSRRDWTPPWELQWSYEGDNKNPLMGPIGWVRMPNYGGKQFENIVQKDARYIHATGLVNLDRGGYRPVLHSHDEPCGEVRIGWGSIEEFEGHMVRIARTRGSFCYGWPINAKGGWRGPRYGKFD